MAVVSGTRSSSRLQPLEEEQKDSLAESAAEAAEETKSSIPTIESEDVSVSNHKLPLDFMELSMNCKELCRRNPIKDDIAPQVIDATKFLLAVHIVSDGAPSIASDDTPRIESLPNEELTESILDLAKRMNLGKLHADESTVDTAAMEMPASVMLACFTLEGQSNGDEDKSEGGNAKRGMLGALTGFSKSPR